LPVGAWAVLGEHELHLYGLVGDASRGTLLRGEFSGTAQAPEALGQNLGAMLLREGAAALLGR
ncbi:MAG: hydroxymethylbilane synthase, partial [Metallibacterium scheffleri]